jgi:tetratricopeptide (TPR) repeat protein
LSLGDNLFRRGQFRDAMRHFELALTLEPGEIDIRVRLDRCKPLLPPPPPPPVIVVVAPPPPPPRLAVLDFVECGNPAVVPPGLGAWTAQNIAPYFFPAYEVVDRGEVFWWMGRLGMTYRDLMTDPSARRWLGRALNVRYFVLGTLRETASFDATTHLLDAETGYVVGAGRIHVESPWELKLRLGELAYLTTLPPAQRPLYQQDANRVNELVVKARLRTRAGEFDIAVGLFQDALKIRPDSIQVLVELQQNQRRSEQAAWEEARRREAARVQAEAAVWQRQQSQLAAAADAARARAAQEMAALSEAGRQEREEQRRRQSDQAQAQLLVQARVALKTQNFSISLQLFESAASLRPSDDAYRELALARAAADRAARDRAAAEEAARQAARDRQRAEELAQVRRRLGDEQARRQDQDLARRKDQERRDGQVYQGLFDQGQRLLAQGKYDEASAALQAARRVRKTDAVEALLSQALVEQARAAAQAKGDEARRALERQLTEEKTRTATAEALARKNQELYTQSLRLAQNALTDKRYDEATSHYQAAAKVYRSDAVLTGLQQADDGRKQVQAAARAAEQKKTEAARRSDDVQRLAMQGRLALEAKQYSKAVEALRAARQLAPDNVDVLTNLAKAEQSQARSAAEAAAGKPAVTPPATVAAKQPADDPLLKAKQEAAALKAKQDAAALEAQQRAAAQERAAAVLAERKRQEQYQALVKLGRDALAARRFDDAVRSFTEAGKVQPGDAAAAALRKQAEQGQLDARRAQEQETAKKLQEQKRQQDFTRLMTAGRSALAQKRYGEAIQAYTDALKVVPGDPGGTRALQDARAAQTAAATPPPVKSPPPPVKSPPPPPVKSPPPPPVKSPAPPVPPAAYTQQMQAGAALEKQKKYAEALKAYQAALRAAPGDAKANAAVQFTQHMDQGLKLLQAGRNAEAAREFEAALRAAPGNAEAQNSLNQARNGKSSKGR